MTRLREVRDSRALSLAELSAKAGVTKANISRIEQGKQQPHPSTIRKLAEALGVEPKDLR